MTLVDGRPHAATARSLRVARSVEELEYLLPAWRELQGSNLVTDPDYYRALLSSAPDVRRPHVIVLESDGVVDGLVVGRIEERSIECRIGYKRILAPRVTSLTVSYGGLLGSATDESTAALVVAELRSALAHGEAEAVYAPHLRSDAPIRAHVSTNGESSPHAGVHWRLQLPPTFDDFLASKSGRSRGRIRRAGKRLFEDHGAAAEIKLYAQPDDLETVLRDAGHVAELTYHHGLGVAFTDRPVQRDLLRVTAERGWFRAYVLYIEDTPRAFWLGTAYRDTFHTGPTGYDPAIADSNPGTALLIRMLTDLCADDAIDVVDYGLGDAEYKHTFGSDSWLESDLLMFGPSFRARSIHVAHTAIAAADRFTRTVAHSRGLGDRVKRRWRQRLSSSA